MDKTTPNPMDEEMARRDRARNVADEAPGRTEVHTYADGSQRVGCAPFPEKSPLEESTQEKRQMANGMVIPPGMATSGERPPLPDAGGLSLEEFTDKAQQQLDSDLAAGKSPNVVNPTASSDKPELAGTDGHVAEAVDIGDNLGAADLDAIAAQIQPTGEAVDVTDEEKAAAVAQAARETGGPILKDDKAAASDKRKPGRPVTVKK